LDFVDTPTVDNISGWSDNLGTCNSTVGRPYMEGAALYSWDQVGAPYWVPWNYMLLFAAKPNATDANGNPVPPTGCSSTNEVIAYATSLSPEGPFTYQGIVMCGSTTEWTNQVSIVQHPVIPQKYLFAWHDGGGTYHQRRTHLMCINWDAYGHIIRVGRSGNNLSNCP
jgi:hypothetical protein